MTGPAAQVARQRNDRQQTRPTNGSINSKKDPSDVVATLARMIGKGDKGLREVALKQFELLVKYADPSEAREFVKAAAKLSKDLWTVVEDLNERKMLPSGMCNNVVKFNRARAMTLDLTADERTELQEKHKADVEKVKKDDPTLAERIETFMQEQVPLPSEQDSSQQTLHFSSQEQLGLNAGLGVPLETTITVGNPSNNNVQPIDNTPENKPSSVSSLHVNTTETKFKAQSGFAVENVEYEKESEEPEDRVVSGRPFQEPKVGEEISPKTEGLSLTLESEEQPETKPKTMQIHGDEEEQEPTRLSSSQITIETFGEHIEDHSDDDSPVPPTNVIEQEESEKDEEVEKPEESKSENTKDKKQKAKTDRFKNKKNKLFTIMKKGERMKPKKRPPSKGLKLLQHLVTTLQEHRQGTRLHKNSGTVSDSKVKKQKEAKKKIVKPKLTEPKTTKKSLTKSKTTKPKLKVKTTLKTRKLKKVKTPKVKSKKIKVQLKTKKKKSKTIKPQTKTKAKPTLKKSKLKKPKLEPVKKSKTIVKSKKKSKKKQKIVKELLKSSKKKKKKRK